MAMPAKTATEDNPSPYAVNKALFEEAAAVKEKMKMVESRLEKMEEHRNEVSEAVYFKVKTDYETNLDGVRQAFGDKCKEVEKELAQLYEAQQEQETLLSGHQEVLEEAKFRHKLGEFNDKKFKDLESTQNKEIKKYSDLLEIIKASIKQYEEILGYSYQQHFRVEAPKPAKPAAPVSVATPAPAPAPEKKTPPAPAAKKASPPPEEDTSRTHGSLAAPPLGETGKTELPPPDAAAEKTDQAFEDKMSDDLDLFLQSEGGDYFTSDAEEAAASQALAAKAKSVAEAKAPEPAPAPVAKDNKGLDDSLSAILKDIPFDDEPAQQTAGAAAPVGEETGAKIEAGAVPEASLILLEGDLDENEYILGENTSLGRSPSNDVVLRETKVSRQHAAINFRDGYYVLVDLKSSNGVFVNGKRIDEMALKDGDELEIGSFKFQFNLS